MQRYNEIYQVNFECVCEKVDECVCEKVKGK